ncbi:MAG TPA: condensation domain-containing protein, partial [Thermoanaerobaculia bacterium]
PLAWGGRVILAEDPLALPGLPAAGEVTLLDTVPSAMDALLRAGRVPPSLRTVNLAGEPLTRELAERVAALPGAPRVLDLYGPSEDTTYSTWASAAPGSGAPGGHPAIGRPVTGTRARVVDARLAPAPAGVPGELVLGGAGLARGYLGRPGRTAERFVPDPRAGHVAEAGARLYKTGDLARWIPDGRLDFLGRLDQQVKIRGFRIEPGEVEARLLEHPAVAEAAVAAWRPDGGEPVLAAWVTPAGEAGVAPLGEALEDDLRRHLGRRLPAHMVPSAFVLVPALPRTPNGKLDRRALPEPRRPAGPTAAAPAAATPFEEVVADAWSEALGLRREGIGLRDDFFRLGGHSLLAASVVSRLRDATGVELPLRRVFENPTVAGLAAELARALAEDGAAPAAAEPALTAAGRPERPPLSFGQERLWFLDRLDPGDPTFNVPFSLRLAGPLSPARLARALAAVARRHEALRTRFAAADGAPFQAVSAPAPAPLPVLDLSGLPAEAAAAEGLRRARAEARRPFDLERGPLFRAVLVRLGADPAGPGEGRHLLLQTLHHAIADAASLEILLAELAALYGADGDPARAGLAPLPVQYADFAVWQRRRLAEGTLERRLERARRRLDGTSPDLALPADGGGARSARGGASLRRELPGAAAEAVRRLGRRAGATPFMVGVAAVEALLHAVGGQEDFTLGTPVAQRERRELEGLIGFFVDTAVLRARLAGDPSFAELVARRREDALQALAAPPPFERLVGALLPDRGPHHEGEASPLFRVMTVFHRVPERREREAGGVRFEPLYLHTGTAQFDLTFSLVESGAELALHLEYDAALFREETARRLLEGWADLLARAAASPDRP